MPRILAASTQMDDHWRQRIKKEEARCDRNGTKPDPFAKSLNTLLHHEQPQVAQPAMESRRGRDKLTAILVSHAQAIQSKIAVEAKRVGEAPTRSAAGASKPRDGSQLSSVATRQSNAQRARVPDDSSDLASAM